jgi:hypothetical protein
LAAEAGRVVKNQYFGDNKDLWKYDLVLAIMQAGLVEQFTFVPMLTEPDGTNHGVKADRRHARAGTRNKELVNFLDECINGGQKDIELMVGFFKRYGIKMTIYYGEGSYFSHPARQSYFAGIESRLLSKSLILVDPDNGLEIKRSGEKHVLYSEVKEIYGRMDGDSILMVYQYFPRASRPDYLNGRMQELKDKISGDYPVCIYDSEIAFFFLTKNESLEHELIHLIGEYSKRYSK